MATIDIKFNENFMSDSRVARNGSIGAVVSTFASIITAFAAVKNPDMLELLGTISTLTGTSAVFCTITAIRYYSRIANPLNYVNSPYQSELQQPYQESPTP